MKVGDIVRQHGNFVKGNLRTNTKTLGVVIKIADTFPNEWQNTSKRKQWAKMLGRGITVLWSNGKIHENFAESALEVVSQSGLEKEERQWLNTVSTDDKINQELKSVDVSIVGQEDEYEDEIELHKIYGGD